MVGPGEQRFSAATSFPHRDSDATYLLAIKCVDPLHDPTFKFNGLCDVGEHLLEGVRRFLIEQHADRLAWLHAAAHHRHQLGSDKVLALSGLPGSLGSQGLHVLLAGRGLHIHRPVGIDVLRVVDLFVEVLWRTYIAFTFKERKEKELVTNLSPSTPQGPSSKLISYGLFEVLSPLWGFTRLVLQSISKRAFFFWSSNDRKPNAIHDHQIKGRATAFQHGYLNVSITARNWSNSSAVSYKIHWWKEKVWWKTIMLQLTTAASRHSVLKTTV